MIEEESRGSSSQQSLDERSRGKLPKLQLGFLDLDNQEAPLSEAGTPRRTTKRSVKSKKTASLAGSSQKLKRSKTKGFKRKKTKKKQSSELDPRSATRKQTDSSHKSARSSMKSNRSRRSMGSARSNRSNRSIVSRRSAREYAQLIKMAEGFEESSETEDSIDPDNYETESENDSKKTKKKDGGKKRRNKSVTAGKQLFQTGLAKVLANAIKNRFSLSLGKQASFGLQ